MGLGAMAYVRRTAARPALRFAGCALALLLPACAVHHVSPEDPAAHLPDHSAAISVGVTDVAGVRRVLGAPGESSTYWRFDLFRATTEQTEVAFAITPWPVPFARLADEIHRYTLIGYDDRDVATSVATGLFRKPAAWRNTSPIESDFRALHLRAGELLFFVDPEGARAVNLLAAPGRRDVYLELARHARGCTAVMGCAGRGCPDEIKVDAEPTRRLPLRTAHVYWIDASVRAAWLAGTEVHGRDPAMPWLETLVAVALPAGEHTFVFTAKHLAGSASTTLVCSPGEVTFLTLEVALEESFWRRSLVDWQITPSAAQPDRFTRRPLVLIDDGKWYVEKEPVR